MLRGGLAGVLPQAYHNMRFFRNLWHLQTHHKLPGLVQHIQTLIAEVRLRTRTRPRTI